jgi:ParB-like chromosome segregation protein Spo0J
MTTTFPNSVGGDPMSTDELEVVSVPIGQLHQDPRNARRHDQHNLATIRASLEQFGQRKPVVATADGTIVAGNGTWAAAASLGWEAISVAWLPFDDPARIRAYAIADNRSGELASWDDEVLLEQVAELRGDFDLEGIGFTETDLARIAARVGADAVAPDGFPQVDENLRTEYCCPRCGHEWSGSPRPE